MFHVKDPPAAQTRTAAVTVDSPLGPLTVREADGAIVSLDWRPADKPDETALLATAAHQLHAYFYCELKAFELPLAPAGSSFQQAVWRRMLTVPYGATESYGSFARALDSVPRAVGAACGRNPIPVIIPCHRVTAENGTLGGYSGQGGVDTKRFLLQLEGGAPGPLFQR